MTARRFRRKPADRPERDLVVAQFFAGQPLADLAEVALLAGSGSVVAECVLPDETVLVARWLDIPDDHPAEQQYVIVRDGNWLYYSETYDHLGEDTTRGIEQFYAPVPEGES